MKLIRLKMNNWKHLPSMEIGPLDQSVTVIHGPNKAGKSTLADAIRKGLFDKFDRKAGGIVPWSHPDAVPEIEIEFIVDGRRFLVHKKFSKNKAGCCTLYEIAEGGERRELASGAEVDEEVRKLVHPVKE